MAYPIAMVCTPWHGTIHKPFPELNSADAVRIKPFSRLQCVSATSSRLARNACRVWLKAYASRKCAGTMAKPLGVFESSCSPTIGNQPDQQNDKNDRESNGGAHLPIPGKTLRTICTITGPKVTMKIGGKMNKTSTGVIF